MKTLMSAEEWFKNLEDEFLYGNSKSELNKKCKTNYDLIYYAIKSYSTYLLNFHLGQFAEECKINTTIEVDWVGCGILNKDIDQTLNDYLTKNNI